MFCIWKIGLLFARAFNNLPSVTVNHTLEKTDSNFPVKSKELYRMTTLKIAFRLLGKLTQIDRNVNIYVCEAVFHPFQSSELNFLVAKCKFHHEMWNVIQKSPFKILYVTKWIAFCIKPSYEICFSVDKIKINGLKGSFANEDRAITN